METMRFLRMLFVRMYLALQYLSSQETERKQRRVSEGRAHTYGEKLRQDDGVRREAIRSLCSFD
jgi:hypothetical protein